MIPFPGKTLADIAVRIATDLLPSLSSTYAQADAGLITGLLLTMSQDYERAVDNRMQDMQEISSLFATLDESIPGHAARSAYLQQKPASFHLAEVTRLHADAFSCLTDLHAWAETNDATLDATIWQILRAHSERNKYELPNL